MNKISIVALLSILVGFTSCETKKEEVKEIVEYSITSPIVKDTTYSKDYVAQIQSIQNVEIHALEKGYLEVFRIDEGQQVKEGQLLFSIMPKIYEAEYMKAKAMGSQVELELLNTKTLADNNIVSKTENT